VITHSKQDSNGLSKDHAFNPASKTCQILRGLLSCKMSSKSQSSSSNPYIDPETNKPWNARALDQRAEESCITLISRSLATMINASLESNQEPLDATKIIDIVPFRPSRLYKTFRDLGYWIGLMDVCWTVRFPGQTIEHEDDEGAEEQNNYRCMGMLTNELDQLEGIHKTRMHPEKYTMCEAYTAYETKQIRVLKSRIRVERAVRQMEKVMEYEGFSTGYFEIEVEDLRRKARELRDTDRKMQHVK
jgi:hypothetical protein